MDFYDQVIDMEGYLLLYVEGTLLNCIPCNWVEKDSTGIRYKNDFGQMKVLDADKYSHIVFKKDRAIFAEDVILLK